MASVEAGLCLSKTDKMSGFVVIHQDIHQAILSEECCTGRVVRNYIVIKCQVKSPVDKSFVLLIHQDSYIFIKNGIHISRFEYKYQDSRMYTSSMINAHQDSYVYSRFAH